MGKSFTGMVNIMLAPYPKENNVEDEVCAIVSTKKGKYKACLEVEKLNK